MKDNIIMKTVLLDRNCNEINDGDFIEIYISEFTDYFAS